MKKLMSLTLFASLLLFSGCFQKWGSKLTTGLNEHIGETGKKLVGGVNEGLADTTAFRKSLNHLLDSVLINAGAKGKDAVRNILDTLFSERWAGFTQRLVEDLTGKQLNGNIQGLKGDLLGPDTQRRLHLLVAAALQEITGDKLPMVAARLREELTGLQLRKNLQEVKDSLLNERTKLFLSEIVDTAVRNFAGHLNGDLKEGVGQNLSLFQKHAGKLLILVGVIALVIIIVIWRLKEKYAKMTTLMASQIYQIPDQRAYDDLTSRIKEKAVIAGVEPSLRKVLEKNGMLGDESRDNWQTKKGL